MQCETNYTKKIYLHSNLRLSLLSLTHGLRFLWTVRVVVAHPVPPAITISVMTYLKTTLIPTPTCWALHTRWRQLLRGIADIILLNILELKNNNRYINCNINITTYILLYDNTSINQLWFSET